MKTLIVALIAIFALAVLPWMIMSVYVNATGIVVSGEVIEKREAIVMTGGDSWKHIFEVTYRYRPLDRPYPETASQRVDPALCRRLHVGSTLRVRYSSSQFLRPMAGVGCFLADSSSLSRLPYGPPDVRAFAELAGLVVASLIGFVAYRTKSGFLSLVAVAIGAACIPGVLLAISGLILFPTLFWAWRRSPGSGYGWALLGTIAWSTTVVYARIPQPTPMPPGPLHEGVAIVRQARVVDQLWTGTGEGEHASDSGGQGIRQPFQMLDLEFTPEDASEPVHVLDRVDLDTVPGLHEGARVSIYYSSADPRLARVAGGTRNYARQAVVYLLAITYGTGAALAFLILPAAYIVGKRIRSSPTLGPLISYFETVKQISRLPADDPRRKALKEFIRARQRS